MKNNVELKRRLKQLKFFKQKSKVMRLAAQGWKEEWQTLVAIMMSAQSRDELTIVIAQNLFKKYPTLKELFVAKQKDVLLVFKSLNYNKTKAKHVVACAKRLINDFGGVVPYDFEVLISLPGVGRKTANVFLAELGEQTIGVDTHVAYISTKMGWTKNTSQERIENDLKNLFPKKYWGSLNYILVNFGKSYTNVKEKNKLILEAKQIK
ncbi:MAG: endonuclease III [archaeon]|jgi:endonuclease-3